MLADKADSAVDELKRLIGRSVSGAGGSMVQ